MLRILFIILLIVFLKGCVSTKAYIKPSRTPEQFRQDAEECRKQEDYDKCMAKKGYRIEANKVKAFDISWINPEAGFKKYEVIFIDQVDTSKVSLKDQLELEALDNKVKPDKEEVDAIAKYMRSRFAEVLNKVMPVELDKAASSGRKAMIIELKLDDLKGADPEADIAPPALIDSSVSKAEVSMECKITDAADAEELIYLIGTYGPEMIDDNASILGTEGFDKWRGVYNTIDFWADSLAGLLAEKRG